MCGIVGIAGANALAAVRAMAERMRHRGPDDDGFHAEDRVTLGMRRLSIIDLAGGKQPMINEDGTVLTVYNGEIYNLPELRAELEGKGHRFRTRSDTEVIVHLYEEHGEDFPRRLNGMFAIALWDARQGRLLLVRDPVGIKPLYWAALGGGRLAFASELKCLLELPEVPRELDPAAIDLYLAYLYVPGPRSIFRGVEKLPPGHLLDWKDGRHAVRRWYSLPERAVEPADEDAKVEELDAILSRAVKRQLVADVPVGVFLSGGLDSSLVVAYAREHTSGPVNTFSIGYGPDAPAFNETSFARSVAERFGTAHRELRADPDLRAIVGPIAWHMDEPFGNSSNIPAWLISERASREVKVMLGGAGGDELFGGYPRLWALGRALRLRCLPEPMRKALAGLLALLPESQRGFHLLRRARTFGRGLRGDPLEGYVRWLLYVRENDAAAVYTPEFRERLAGAAGYGDPVRDYLDRVRRTPDTVHDAYRLDAETWLPYNILEYSDKMSMMASVEQRVPLLDQELVEFAFRLPRSLCIRGRSLKHLLKRVAERRLPRDIVHRPKQGFMVPIGLWVRGPLKPYVQDCLGDEAVRKRGILRPEFVRALLKEHESGRRDRTHHIWTLAMLEQWFRCYVDR